jgi:hypothetical protein
MLIRWQYYGPLDSGGPSLFFVGVVLLLLGALFVALVAGDVYRLQRLATEGLPTIGTVVKKSMRRADDQGRTDTSYEVEYVLRLLAAADSRAPIESTRRRGTPLPKVRRSRSNTLRADRRFSASAIVSNSRSAANW